MHQASEAKVASLSTELCAAQLALVQEQSKPPQQVVEYVVAAAAAAEHNAASQGTAEIRMNSTSPGAESRASVETYNQSWIHVEQSAAAASAAASAPAPAPAPAPARNSVFSPMPSGHTTPNSTGLGPPPAPKAQVPGAAPGQAAASTAGAAPPSGNVPITKPVPPSNPLKQSLLPPAPTSSGTDGTVSFRDQISERITFCAIPTEASQLRKFRESVRNGVHAAAINSDIAWNWVKLTEVHGSKIEDFCRVSLRRVLH